MFFFKINNILYLKFSFLINNFFFYFIEVGLCFCLIFLFLQSSLYVFSKNNTQVLLPLYVMRRLIKLLMLFLVFIFFNPYLWLFSKQIYNHFFITTMEITLLKFIILCLCILILKSNSYYLQFEKLDIRDFLYFFGFLIFFFLLILQCNDFFIVFLMFEAISLLLYLIIIYIKKFYSFEFLKKNNFTKYQLLLLHFKMKSHFLTLNILSTVLYILLNIFISFFFLIGLFLLIIFFQSTNYNQLLVIFFYNFNYFFIDVQFYCFFFFLLIFLFKLGIFPFHWWVSAIFESTSLLTLMFLAIPLKCVILLILLKLFFLFFAFIHLNLQLFLTMLSLLSMLIGTLGLFQQTKLKKFWAYSTINNMGYFLLAINSLCFLGIRAFVIYLIFYILINLLFFFLLQSLINETLSQRLVFINQLTILMPYKNHIIIFFFSLLIFSLIGIPPSLGFWGKYLMIMSVFFNYSFFWFFFILFIIFFTTILTCFCYLKIWKTLFLENNLITNNFKLLPIPIFQCIALFFLSCVLIIFSLLFFINFYFFSDFDRFIVFYIFKN